MHHTFADHRRIERMAHARFNHTYHQGELTITTPKNGTRCYRVRYTYCDGRTFTNWVDLDAKPCAWYVDKPFQGESDESCHKCGRPLVECSCWIAHAFIR